MKSRCNKHGIVAAARRITMRGDYLGEVFDACPHCLTEANDKGTGNFEGDGSPRYYNTYRACELREGPWAIPFFHNKADALRWASPENCVRRMEALQSLAEQKLAKGAQ